VPLDGGFVPPGCVGAIVEMAERMPSNAAFSAAAPCIQVLGSSIDMVRESHWRAEIFAAQIDNLSFGRSQ
jgi:hypothetical protein